MSHHECRSTTCTSIGSIETTTNSRAIDRSNRSENRVHGVAKVIAKGQRAFAGVRANRQRHKRTAHSWPVIYDPLVRNKCFAIQYSTVRRPCLFYLYNNVKETISRVCNFSQFFVTVIIGSTRTVNDLSLFSLFAFERIVVAPPTVTVS